MRIATSIPEHLRAFSVLAYIRIVSYPGTNSGRWTVELTRAWGDKGQRRDGKRRGEGKEKADREDIKSIDAMLSEKPSVSRR